MDKFDHTWSSGVDILHTKIQVFDVFGAVSLARTWFRTIVHGARIGIPTDIIRNDNGCKEMWFLGRTLLQTRQVRQLELEIVASMVFTASFIPYLARWLALVWCTQVAKTANRFFFKFFLIKYYITKILIFALYIFYLYSPSLIFYSRLFLRY